MKGLRKIWLMAPLAIVAAACGKSAPDDAALKNDLALASQQFVPITSAKIGSRSSAGTVYSEPAPQPTRVIKHTKRDAAIGAVAGAVIGAATSRDKVKGGLIGAAAGAILGGVIGNNVDVKRVPNG